MNPAIRMVKKMLISVQMTNRASKFPEWVDAESGKRGNDEFMSGGSQGTGLGGLPPPQDNDQKHQGRDGDHRRHAHDVQGHGAVAADQRIVVEAVAENLVDQRAQLS